MTMSKKVCRSGNILIVLDILERGGATRLNQEIISTLNDMGWKVSVLSGVVQDENPPFKEFNDVSLHHYDVRGSSKFWLLIKTIFGSFIGYFKLGLDIRFSRIILNLPGSSLGIMLNPLSWGIKKIYLFHGATDLEEMSLKKYDHGDIDKKTLSLTGFGRLKFLFRIRLNFLIQKFVMKMSSKVIVFSEYSKKLVIRHFGINSSKIRKVKAPLSFSLSSNRISLQKKKEILESYNVGSGNHIFLIPSRLEPRKGIHVFLEALRYLKKKYKLKFVSILTGDVYDNSYWDSLLKKCKQYKLGRLVNFADVLERCDLYELYQSVDCVIMPSIDLETLGLVTIESMFFGCPVIGFSTGGTKEILSKVDNRLLVKKVSPINLASKIMWFMELKQSEKNKLAKKCSEKVVNLVDSKEIINLF